MNTLIALIVLNILGFILFVIAAIRCAVQKRWPSTAAMAFFATFWFVSAILHFHILREAGELIKEAFQMYW